jgi:hypothetical protein
VPVIGPGNDEPLIPGYDQPGSAEGGGLHRTALSAVMHPFEKVGDHWEPKAEKGTSDAKAAAGSTRDARAT